MTVVNYNCIALRLSEAQIKKLDEQVEIYQFFYNYFLGIAYGLKENFFYFDFNAQILHLCKVLTDLKNADLQVINAAINELLDNVHEYYMNKGSFSGREAGNYLTEEHHYYYARENDDNEIHVLDNVLILPYVGKLSLENITVDVDDVLYVYIRRKDNGQYYLNLQGFKDYQSINNEEEV